MGLFPLRRTTPNYFNLYALINRDYELYCCGLQVGSSTESRANKTRTFLGLRVLCSPQFPLPFPPTRSRICPRPNVNAHELDVEKRLW